MGSPPEEWGRGAHDEEQHPVRLTHAFAMMDHELTQAEWGRVEAPIDLSLIRDAEARTCETSTCPAGNLNWFDTLVYANSLSRQAGLSACYSLDGCSVGHPAQCTGATPIGNVYECDGYRLPTEAEWEYAARAGTSTAFWSGDILVLKIDADCKVADPALESVAWYCVNAGSTTHEVGLKEANPFGLFDMMGNAAEYVNDEFHDYEGPAVDPLRWIGTDKVVEMRGGPAIGWSQLLRLADRSGFGSVDATGSQAGFRLVRTLKPGTTLAGMVDMTVVR